jgi:Putative polyhydroxyalkanoic acid system protein (PHA_gran_rgn)
MELDPIVVTIPHRHGKAEAMRRVKAGIESARARYPAQLKVAEEKWEGDRLTFRAAALGQPVTGTIDIAEDNVRAEVRLSWFWGHMVKPAEALIQHEGTQMLSGG